MMYTIYKIELGEAWNAGGVGLQSARRGDLGVTPVPRPADAATADIGAAEPPPIEPRTLADEVADRIVQSIAAGRHRPGDRILEGETANALNVSRVPVREAFRRLEAQGILVNTPNRGSTIAVFDEKKIEELYEVRTAIETIAARHAVAVLGSDPAGMEVLERIIDEMRVAALAGDVPRVSRTDLEFHRALIEISGHDLAATIWAGLSQHVLIVFGMETYRDPDLHGVVRQHEDLRDAIVGGDLPAIDREIVRHITGYRALKLSQGGQ